MTTQPKQSTHREAIAPESIVRVPLSETLTAWAQLLTVVFIIVVSILYGWPKYKRYLAVEAAKTEVAVDSIYDAAIIVRHRNNRLAGISRAAGKQTGLQVRDRRAAVVSESAGSRAKGGEDRSRQRSPDYAGTTGRVLLPQIGVHEFGEQLRHWRQGDVDRRAGKVTQSLANAYRQGLPALPTLDKMQLDHHDRSSEPGWTPKSDDLSQAYNGHKGLQVAEL